MTHRDDLEAVLLALPRATAKHSADAVIEFYRNPERLMALIREVRGPVEEVFSSGVNLWSSKFFTTHLPDDRATLLARRWMEGT
jgi:hypothetical protein